MIKQWSKAHSDLMASYHIEVLFLKSFDAVLSDYPWDVLQFFEQALKLVQSPLTYEDGYADEYLEDNDDREEILSRLEAARDRARKAWYLTYNGRSEHSAAINIWRQVFGDKFPAYG